MEKDIFGRALQTHPYSDAVGEATRAKIRELRQRGLGLKELHELDEAIKNGTAGEADLALFDHSSVTFNPTSAAIYWITLANQEG